jgi:hypothetical protein
MRILVWVTLIAAILWGGYWFVGSRAVEKGAVWALAEARNGGLVSEYESISVAGFPNRFDVTLTNPRFGDPLAGVLWTAPFIQIFTLSYKPWHYIAAISNQQTLELPGERLAITSDRMQGSLVLEPSLELVPDRSALLIEALSINGNGGFLLGAEKLQWGSRQTVGRPLAHDLALEGRKVVPMAHIQAVMQRAGLPTTLDLISVVAEVTFDHKITLAALDGPPGVNLVRLKEAIVQLGDLRIFAEGELKADAQGLAEGTLLLRINGWQDVPAALSAAGLIKPEAVIGLSVMLQGLSSQTDGQTIEAPLSFGRGLVTFGFVPLGPAPRLR